MPIRSHSHVQGRGANPRPSPSILARVLPCAVAPGIRSTRTPAPGLVSSLALVPTLALLLTSTSARALPEFHWSGEGTQTAEAFGFGVTPAGDVNGDGYDDFVIGSAYYDLNGADRGRVRAYYGSPSGLGVTSWQYDGEVADAHLGYSAAGVGDVNGDGYDDVLLGAPLAQVGNHPHNGFASLFLGSATGLPLEPDWYAIGANTDDLLGSYVAGLGDINGDGYADFGIGAPGYDVGGTLSAGKVDVYLGGPGDPVFLTSVIGSFPSSLVGTIFFGVDFDGDGYADLVHLEFQADASAKYRISSGGPGGLTSTSIGFVSGNILGTSGAPGGDVNGDGYEDILLGAANEGAPSESGVVRVVYGAATAGEIAYWTLTEPAAGAHFGSVVAPAGDVNGDGYADFLAQARNAGTGAEVRFYFGAPDNGEERVDDSYWSSAEFDDEYYGWRLGTAGDVDGDGHSELFIGSPYRDGTVNGGGRVDVLRGGTDAPGELATFYNDGDSPGDLYGTAVAFGDFNGDGADDAVVGSGSIDLVGSDSGRVFVYYGPAAPNAAPDWVADGENSSLLLGDAVASALDVDGDGYEDLLVGAPGHDGGRGQARLYRGGASGLETFPSWTAVGDAATDAFGSSVASAGDVDADGFGDVIIGAPGGAGSTRRGKAMVFRGGPAGLEASPSWIATGDQPDAELGFSVASAGDVDGDGYGDVIVGAPRLDGTAPNEGAAFVYFGSGSGISPAAPWTIPGGTTGARLGYSVASAGDVDADGFGDVVVGAPFHGSGGRTVVYHGAPALAGFGLEKEWFAPQAGSKFGWSVASADLDRDGRSDIVVGAPGVDNGQVDEGQVWAYRAPFTDTDAWFANDGNVDFCGHGSAVAVGDFSGDGVGDILGAAPGLLGTSSSTGTVYLWPGNGLWRSGVVAPSLTEGVPHLWRMRTPNDDGPVALLGAVEGAGIRIAGSLQSPLGRARVRLEVEAKPTGVPFDGTGTEVSGVFDTGAPSAGIGSVVHADLFVPGLGTGAYHYRVRMLGDHPRWKRSPWYTPVRNAPTATDFRTGLDVAGVEDGTDGSGPGGTGTGDGTNGNGAEGTGASGTEATTLLLTAAPNPFPGSTELSFRMAHSGHASLVMYDLQGRQVERVLDGWFEAGNVAVTWDAPDRLPAGVYFARLEVDGGRVDLRVVRVGR
ncbi:MAG: FG-GAP-like repeat-containing protein [Candidatus Eisenbacteria bacterium]